jgi:hypothetical protein
LAENPYDKQSQLENRWAARVMRMYRNAAAPEELACCPPVAGHLRVQHQMDLGFALEGFVVVEALVQV